MDNELKERIGRIGILAEQVKSPAAIELVQTMMDFHRAAIDRMMEIVADGDQLGLDLIAALAGDELVSNMLLLHGLHPLPIDERVKSALDGVRPYLNSHGGDVELIEIAEGIVKLRMVGTCGDCPSSTATLKGAIEKAIREVAPEIVSIQSEEFINGPSTAISIGGTKTATAQGQ
jgi:Fe-S cluster biogenesis protein NfuA